MPFKDKKPLGGKAITRNLNHKKEFAMTGNFAASPKRTSEERITAVAALHNSEYGSFNKDGKLRPIGDLSDDQQTPDELRSVDRT